MQLSPQAKSEGSSVSMAHSAMAILLQLPTRKSIWCQIQCAFVDRAFYLGGKLKQSSPFTTCLLQPSKIKTTQKINQPETNSTLIYLPYNNTSVGLQKVHDKGEYGSQIFGAHQLQGIWAPDKMLHISFEPFTFDRNSMWSSSHRVLLM